jgi:protein-S-isoprenylcysteine O-methyltransferase Ste14
MKGIAVTSGYAIPRGELRLRARLNAPAVADRLARVVVVLVFSALAFRLGTDWVETGHLTGMLLVANEGLVVALTLVRRSAGVVDRTWVARLLTVFSTFGPSMVTPLAAGALAPDLVTIGIAGAGLVVVVIGKLSLGRSFGLIPANRGIVSTGFYKLVRHPIYLGYLITHTGFFLANPAGWNLFALVAADIALMVRAVREERTLMQDPAYRAYAARVRWRIVPGVF